MIEPISYGQHLQRKRRKMLRRLMIIFIEIVMGMMIGLTIASTHIYYWSFSNGKMDLWISVFNHMIQIGQGMK